uniref:Uncharacterized protein n=1 Tax=Romanomermis culicivorax TaxID=13658 RepID=A0A915HT30_ROMCU
MLVCSVYDASSGQSHFIKTIMSPVLSDTRRFQKYVRKNKVKSTTFLVVIVQNSKSNEEMLRAAIFSALGDNK